ncbi:MAG: glyceraldehyde-3-phosphate dehydrogenase [Bacteroidota bacterium]
METVEKIKANIGASLADWREQEKKALLLLKIVGELRFDKSVELILFRRGIYDSRPSEVLNDHLYAKNYAHQPITIDISLALAKGISRMNIAPARIDIGKLAIEWLTSNTEYSNLDAFLFDKIGHFIGEDKKVLVPKDVVLYGFGRIGRLAARELIENTGRGEQLRLKAIVIRPKMKDNRAEEMLKRASLLRKDTVHGKFRGTVDVDQETEDLIVNGNRIKMIFANSPTDIDYTKYGIQDALLIDNTGAWRDKEGLSQHLRPGIKHVLFTAPGKGIKNIVHGVNHKTLDFNEDIVFCAASCTTNAIAPVIKVVNDNFGIENGHIESIHAYTSTQNLLDNFHKKSRRGRAAAENMVITETGAAKAIGKVIPELDGTLTGSAIRIPLPNVSLAILNLNLQKETSVNQINEVLEQASLYGDLVVQIKYSNSMDFVSSDAVGATHTSVFDAPSTKVSPNGKNATLYVWYDNEYGYTCQVLRLAKYVAQVRRLRYY